MVLESHAGGWSGKSRGFVDWLARASAAAHHADAAQESLTIAQRVSVTLEREERARGSEASCAGVHGPGAERMANGGV